jgi:hypothetical protein
MVEIALGEDPLAKLHDAVPIRLGSRLALPFFDNLRRHFRLHNGTADNSAPISRLLVRYTIMVLGMYSQHYIDRLFRIDSGAIRYLLASTPGLLAESSIVLPRPPDLRFDQS